MEDGHKTTVQPFPRRGCVKVSRTNFGGFMRIKLLSPPPRLEGPTESKSVRCLLRMVRSPLWELPIKLPLNPRSSRATGRTHRRHWRRQLAASQATQTQRAFLAHDMANKLRRHHGNHARRQSSAEAAAAGTETW